MHLEPVFRRRNLLERHHHYRNGRFRFLPLRPVLVHASLGRFRILHLERRIRRQSLRDLRHAVLVRFDNGLRVEFYKQFMLLQRIKRRRLEHNATVLLFQCICERTVPGLYRLVREGLFQLSPRKSLGSVNPFDRACPGCSFIVRIRLDGG